jgi:type IV pilus assembly protein PilV
MTTRLPLRTARSLGRRRGLTLIEVLVSTMIFSFGILGLLGMHARAMATFSDAKYRTDAALLAESLLSEIWVNRANVATYAYAGGTGNATIAPWVAEVKLALPNAAPIVAVNGNAVRVTISWQPPSAAAAGVVHSHTEIATIQNP